MSIDGSRNSSSTVQARRSRGAAAARAASGLRSANARMSSIGELRHRFQVRTADVAAADDADADFVHEPQPFTEPMVRPATMCRCAAKNIMITGRMVSVMKASTSCQSVEYSPW